MEVKEESAGLRHLLPASLSSSTLWLVSLTLLAAILRSIFLGAKSLWLDEAWSAYRASEPLSALAHQAIGLGQINMGLYHLFLHWWIDFAGSSEIGLRVPSVIFATATVPLVYAVGKELFDTETSLLAALLVAVNVSNIRPAQEARSYALIGMMVTLAALLFLRAIKDPSVKRCVSYTITGGACAYIHFFGFLVFPAHFVSLFAFPGDRKTRQRLVICLTVIGALSLIPIGLGMTLNLGQAKWVPPTSGTAILRLFAMMAGVLWGKAGGAGWIPVGVYLAATAIAVVGCRPSERGAMVFLLSTVLLPITIAIVVSTMKHLFVPRYLLICLPFFVLLATRGLKQIRPRPIMVSVAMLMVVLSLRQDRRFYYSPSPQEWRGAVALTAGEDRPGDALIVFPDWNACPVNYYLDRLDPRPAFPVVAARVNRIREAAAYADVRVGLRQFLRSRGVGWSERIWILTDDAHVGDPGLKSLSAGHEVTDPHRFPGVKLYLIE